MKYVRRCKDGCRYFYLPNKKERWGYCILKKEQRSKWAKVCKAYKR